ncbi:ribosomal protein S18-alanine N-acetyltransferase [Paracoccus sp. (in: a-proteobacteria)]|uniref:ribosomal protein S18-alanine N-acetyltransferase n=1 Tax=Paracoccus sp. TaxID=267 RepID=UPI0026DF0565|nr:ribosomal protein S18-alanine N-acetyltransferase [Paracoccus sp. (in: a-proteobacteria)]MDO5647200.1 ribosomal protein S18-alanine N-acetyltransferase [Paracoccus sp. (in: a-proteobacteria)]
MTPDDLAALHARCFTIPRPWSAAEITDVLTMPGAFLLTHRAGFLIGRVIANEAELLTVAVSPDARRQGVGRDLLRRFTHAAREKGAACAFLEVAHDNAAARALYHGAGWEQVGRRKRYYAGHIDAVIMRVTLGSDTKCG